MSHLADNLLVFGRLLRALGLDVHMGRMLDVLKALQHVDIAVRDEVYHTCRALLVHRREDLGTFDRAFEVFWSRKDAVRQPVRVDDQRDAGPAIGSSSAVEIIGDAVAGEGEGGALRTYSAAATLATKDFADFTADELAVARAALDRLVWNPGERRTRRWVRGAGPRIDLRRALAGSLRTGGDVIRLPRRTRRVRRRPIVLLCDVSGSMERYSRMLLHFSHALGRRHVRVEAFVFSTTLTRITHELRTRRLDAAVAGAARAVPDWSGGTRIGEALRTLHQRWMRRVLHGGPVVLLVSDGWDRGDPDLLRQQVARLQRSCHRLIWLNPLIGTTDYAPLTRGLQAALPYVDDFLPARTLTNLVDLSVHLNKLHGHRRHLHIRGTPGSRLDAPDGSAGDFLLHPRL
ncbi:MAG TPA: VWA domain-containing protein [Vicinamibacterales bacterium]|nr:VWA domain-containing protein [Vicinamibacterales bacterium]